MDLFCKAKPIWPKNKCDEMNFRVIFRTCLEIKDSDKINIATSLVYNLYIDGDFVAYGPARAGRNHFRKDIIDIGEFSKQKKSVIVIAVESYRVNSFYIMNQEPFLQAEIVRNGDATVFTGDNTFEIFEDKSLVRRVQRFSFQRPFVEAYDLKNNSLSYLKVMDEQELLECEILKDKTIIDRISPYPEYNYICAKPFAFGKAKYNKCEKYTDIRSYTNIGKLLGGYKPNELKWHVHREIEDYKFSLTDTNCKTTLFANEFQIYELPTNTAGFPTFDVKANKDSILYLIFDEVLENGDINAFRDECCRVIKYNIEAGNYHLKLFEVYGMKYIKIFVSNGECEISDLHLITYIHKAPKNKFHSKEKNEELLICSAENTFNLNAVDILTDCPTRERAGWFCDSLFSGRVEYLLNGNNDVEYSLLQNLLFEEKYECIFEKMIPMCYPADHLDGVCIPNWGLWLILEIYEYSKRNNDMVIIKAFEKKIRGIIDFHIALENKQHLLTHIPEGVFVEWSHANEMVQDINFPSNMIYVAALKTASKMYNDKLYFDRAEEVKKAILKYSYIDGFFCDSADYINGEVITKKESSEVCQYYAFDFNIADKETYIELYNKLLNDFSFSRRTNNKYPDICYADLFMGIPLRVEMLIRYGEYEKAKEEIMYYYLPQAQKTGTFWEALCGNSYCHALSSVVLYWLQEINNKKTYEVIGK